LTKKPRILFVVEYYYPHIGGVEFLFQSIAEYLASEGYTVGVVTARVNNTPRYEVLNGVTIHRLSVPKRGSRYFFTFFGIFGVLPIARKYDCIHTTTYNAAVPGSLAGFLLRKRVILTVHEVWINLWEKIPGISSKTKNMLRMFEKGILGMPYSEYVSVSEATQRDLLSYKPQLKPKSQVIYNGINYDALPKPQTVTKNHKAQKTLLYFGRPGVSKGVENLITACNATTNKNLRIRLVVSKDENARYEQLCSTITNDLISMEPSLPRNGLFMAIQEADYVIIPSLSEGFGYSALEASIYAQKLICSNQGSLPEVVFGDVLFYNPWQPEELTTILNTLESAPFTTIKPKFFPIAEAVKAYSTLYESAT